MEVILKYDHHMLILCVSARTGAYMVAETDLQGITRLQEEERVPRRQFRAQEFIDTLSSSVAVSTSNVQFR